MERANMKNGMHLKASSPPRYHAVASRPRQEGIAQCGRCHAKCTVEIGPLGARVLGFQVHNIGEEGVIRAEARWRDLDRRAIVTRDPQITKLADVARVDLYRLRDAVNENPRFHHRGCGGTVEFLSALPGTRPQRVYQRALLS